MPACIFSFSNMSWIFFIFFSIKRYVVKIVCHLGNSGGHLEISSVTTRGFDQHVTGYHYAKHAYMPKLKTHKTPNYNRFLHRLLYEEPGSYLILDGTFTLVTYYYWLIIILDDIVVLAYFAVDITASLGRHSPSPPQHCRIACDLREIRALFVFIHTFRAAIPGCCFVVIGGQIFGWGACSLLDKA